jgi:hypothetical protein
VRFAHYTTDNEIINRFNYVGIKEKINEQLENIKPKEKKIEYLVLKYEVIGIYIHNELRIIIINNF